MIPLRDVIPSRTHPLVTVLLMAINGGVFVYELSLPEAELRAFVQSFGVVPAAFSASTVISSMFLHGGWLHFIGNMLYLWIFGDNVEDRVGHGRFVLFYVLCGVLATAAQIVQTPDSQVPMIGASGAIAGVMGAYLVLYPHSRVLTLVPIFFFWRIVELPAVLLLGVWFMLQLVSVMGPPASGVAPTAGGIAFWAHAAGFVAGALLIFVFRRPERQRVEWWD